MLCVLHIEDHPSNARLVQRLVERRGTVCPRLAATGREGPALAADLRPDLVLLDLHLPDLSGEVVLHRLWALPGLSGTPVVVLTADATAQTAQRLRELGVRDQLTEPLDVTAFDDQLDRAEARLAAGQAPGQTPERSPEQAPEQGAQAC